MYSKVQRHGELATALPSLFTLNKDAEASSSYLPVYEGMPHCDASAPLANLTSTSAVEAFLAGTPFECRSVTQFTAGNINYVYRLHLISPIGGIETAVFKHAQPFWKGSEVACDVDRQKFEVEAMTRARRGLPSTLPVTIPEIYHFDAHNHIIILEDCGSDVVTLKDLIPSGNIPSPSVAKVIGSAVGEFIAALHEWSRSNPDGILDVFDKCPHAHKLVNNEAYDHQVSTLDGTDEDDLPLLSGVAIDPSDIQTIQKLTDEYRAHSISPRDPTRDVFLMGDLFYTNVLVSTDLKQKPLRIYLLDWELARTGLPGLELGMFCGFVGFHSRGDAIIAETASTIQESFLGFSDHTTGYPKAEKKEKEFDRGGITKHFSQHFKGFCEHSEARYPA